MYRFTDFPPQSLRDSISEVLSTYNMPLGSTELSEHVFEVLEINEPIFTEHQEYLQSILDDMVLSGRVIKKDDTYIVGDTRKDGNEETYHITTLESPSENPVLINGSTIVNSIGSEYYPEAWANLENHAIVTCELIPEPHNPYDNNAVAVTINNQLVGHLTRTVAREYFHSIVGLNHLGYTLCVEGEILASPNDENYRFVQLAMPKPEAIEPI